MDTNSNKNGSEKFKIIGDWNEQSKELKEKFSQLTDSDLKFEPGKENELIERVGNRLNKKADEVMNIIKKATNVKSNGLTS
ncbi:hypothetical protein [Empedobacter brevis]|uniref:General stress protein CsbD n=1 Tax=Empedobacter brevis NBRC 14943 = ATCC 43319 TaxID=1218108 RepID=A0A511NF65_9FLAO|nr:hypothetical protein [Empedobacter brevis]GEM51473.1 hypothetical protein EB1_12630 [Empedobacter brevis NBRC 14943 = ATCC 43319]